MEPRASRETTKNGVGCIPTLGERRIEPMPEGGREGWGTYLGVLVGLSDVDERDEEQEAALAHLAPLQHRYT